LPSKTKKAPSLQHVQSRTTLDTKREVNYIKKEVSFIKKHHYKEIRSTPALKAAFPLSARVRNLINI
ncbi:hypothetical protein, partial [Alkalicoccobacillus gibsonii]|uniref:hypothetical protein n=1 Tax=Alkalicoccobacillus gibsonii TaxID=79881 RepID=UPI003515B91F